jgi:hypothetical protein
MHPFAAVMRWNVRIDQDDGGYPRGRDLVVTRLGPGGVCRVGTVLANDNPAANEMARQIADKHARAFRCGVDKADDVPDDAAK